MKIVIMLGKDTEASIEILPTDQRKVTKIMQSLKDWNKSQLPLKDIFWDWNPEALLPYISQRSLIDNWV